MSIRRESSAETAARAIALRRIQPVGLSVSAERRLLARARIRAEVRRGHQEEAASHLDVVARGGGRRRGNPGRCSKCSQEGHYKSTCPTITGVPVTSRSTTAAWLSFADGMTLRAAAAIAGVSHQAASQARIRLMSYAWPEDEVTL